MKVIICGAGQVGFGIAQHLAAEDNDVSVIDSNTELVQSVSENLDVQGILGHGAHPEVLERAGAREADMIIAVTFTDEVNMMACQIAHSLFDIPTKIARVRSRSYLDPMWRDMFSRNHMPIDAIISPEMAVADMVLRRLAVPGAFETISFGDDKAISFGVSCEEDCPIVNTPLSQLTELFPDLKAVVVGIARDGKLFVPRSQDQILVGDDVYVVVDRDQLKRTLAIFGHEEKEARKIVIAGGGNVGFYVASKITDLNLNIRVKIIELNKDRAVFIADQLKNLVILNGSALELEILREVGISDVDAFIALSNDDKVNLLSAVMAKQEGARRALSLITSADYSGILRPLGIDAPINPRAITISNILQHVRKGRIRSAHSVNNGQAEIIEAEALQTSSLVGRQLRETNLPNGTRVGCVIRGDEVITPNGDMVITSGDKVVIFAISEKVKEVEQLFRVSLEYF